MLTIRLKLVLLAVVAFGSTTTVALIGLRGLDQLHDTSERVLDSAAVTQTQQHADMMHDALRADVLASVLATSDDERQASQHDAEQHALAFRTAFATNQRALVGHAIDAELTSVGSKVEAYIVEAQRLIQLSTENPSAGLAGIAEFRRLFKSLELDLAEITKALAADSASIHSNGTAGVTRALGLGSVLAAILTLLISLVIARSITRPLRRTVEVLAAVSNRDFTQRLDVSGRDEIGQMARALNEAVDNMRHALMEVRTVSHELADASLESAEVAQTISAGAQDQAAGLEQTSASIEEITATVKQSAENARQASLLAGGSRETAERGGLVVGEAIQAMTEINQASTRIAEIISTIDEIAFQTNLLALNAAVEAARAGDQGRGFAVVATEVRSLAQRSALAAKEIKSLIQDSVRKVESGSALVNKSGQALHEIVQSVRKVTEIVNEMASTAREQSIGIDQVNQAVAQMDRVTQGNATQTEAMAATAQSMTEQSEQLRGLVARFRLDEAAARSLPLTSTTAATAPARPRSRWTPHPAAPRGLRPLVSGRARMTGDHPHDASDASDAIDPIDAFMHAADDQALAVGTTVRSRASRS